MDVSRQGWTMAKSFHHMTMDAIMREWPATIRVILDRGLLCVGCPVASFHTLSEAAREHSVDQRSLDRDIQIAIEAIKPGDG
jgi:hybrid cluster-associated redox disulfide protein